MLCVCACVCVCVCVCTGLINDIEMASETKLSYCAWRKTTRAKTITLQQGMNEGMSNSLGMGVVPTGGAQLNLQHRCQV